MLVKAGARQDAVLLHVLQHLPRHLRKQPLLSKTVEAGRFCQLGIYLSVRGGVSLTERADALEPTARSGTKRQMSRTAARPWLSTASPSSPSFICASRPKLPSPTPATSTLSGSLDASTIASTASAKSLTPPSVIMSSTKYFC
eukprot:COSAG01_NODE_232_length_21016_cov_51.558876_14_plen_143_part_00